MHRFCIFKLCFWPVSDLVHPREAGQCVSYPSGCGASVQGRPASGVCLQTGQGAEAFFPFCTGNTSVHKTRVNELVCVGVCLAGSSCIPAATLMLCRKTCVLDHVSVCLARWHVTFRPTVAVESGSLL